jgi:uncharacterized membrane protein
MSTTHQVPKINYEPMHLPQRNPVPVGAPLQWLKSGWGYWRSVPLPSLVYGLVFALIGAGITALGLSRPQFIFTFWSGFLLVGPFFALGLYRIAQQTDQGNPISFSRCMQVLGSQRAMVGVFSVVLGLIMIAWIRVSTLAVALYVGSVATPSAMLSVLSSPAGLGFLATLFGIGALFAVGLFLVTAWSLPMVIDGKADVATAIASSVKAVTEQPLPMLVWAGLVSLLTLVGMLTFFAGFVVIFPLLGYATWAGYQALFGSR